MLNPYSPQGTGRMRIDLGRGGLGSPGLRATVWSPWDTLTPLPGELDDIIKELHGPHDVLVLWSWQEGGKQRERERAYQRHRETGLIKEGGGI